MSDPRPAIVFLAVFAAGVLPVHVFGIYTNVNYGVEVARSYLPWVFGYLAGLLLVAIGCGVGASYWPERRK